MTYFQITKVNKVKREEHFEFPYEIYRRIVILLATGLVIGFMACLEKLFLGKVLIVWFIPIFILLIYINLKIFRR